MYVAAGRLRGCLVLAASQCLGCRLELACAPGEPVLVLGPPAAARDVLRLQPLVSASIGIVGDAVAGAALGAGRVDERLDVAADREHEAFGAAEQLRAAIGVFPWDDVIVEARDRSRASERVLERGADEVAV